MWKAPTEQDLKISISDDELDSYRDAAKKDMSFDTVEEILARTATLVRGYCRANTNVRLGPAGTIPAGLIAPAMDYAAVDVVKRLPAGVTDERNTARAAALQIFRDVAEGKMQPESFGEPDDASAGSSIQLANTSPQRFTPDNMAGL